MTADSGPNPLACTEGVALPRGSSDLMPPAYRLRRALTSGLLATFESWGYEPVATPAIEYFDVLARGLSEDDRRGSVRFIAAGSGELVSLRADVTPQIVRMMAQRWGGELASDVVHRFSYAADVLRQPQTPRQQAEGHQVGVELVGDDHPAADAEMVALAEAALRGAGLSEFRLDLAHTGLVRGLLDTLHASAAERAELRALLARKDRGGVLHALGAARASTPIGIALGGLCDLFGPVGEVLPRARQVLAGVGVDAELQQLEAVLQQLGRMDQGRADADSLRSRLTIDLGEARGYDYYSGMRLRGWAPGVPDPVVRGGRYDGLPGRYGVPRPATGFAIDLHALERGLTEQGRGTASIEVTPGHLVVVADGEPEARAQAHALACEARTQGRRAWVQPGVTMARARTLAEAAGADRITFVDERGTTEWARGPQGWERGRETP